jgi:thiamine transport system substrate-binding protein
MKKLLSLAVALLMACLPGCQNSSTPQEPQTLTLMTHDSFKIGDNLIKKFEQKYNVKLTVIKGGDAGSALNQALLSKENPLADVFYGVDNTFMSRALQADLFVPYASPLLSDIDDRLKLDPQNRLLPVDYGDVCLNYDKKWFQEKGLAPPRNLEDLIDPRYAGLTVLENPATSSPGLAFLLATIGRFGDPGYLEYWKKLRDNNVLVTNGWEDAYYGHFSAASDDDRPIVVSYATSPPAEVFFSEKPLEDAPTAAVIEDGAVFRQIEFVGILKGTSKRDLAEKLVDFMLSREFQEDIPLNMFVFPANKKAALPEVFEKYARSAEHPVEISFETIDQKREEWMEKWTETVLR